MNYPIPGPKLVWHTDEVAPGIYSARPGTTDARNPAFNTPYSAEYPQPLLPPQKLYDSGHLHFLTDWQKDELLRRYSCMFPPLWTELRRLEEAYNHNRVLCTELQEIEAGQRGVPSR